MMPTVIAIAIAYAVLGTLLLSLNIAARWPWWVKAGTIAITGVFYVLVFAATERLLGWPSRGALPAKFQLLASHVVEPARQDGSSGAIYLWIDELDDANLPKGVPRNFAIPYSFVLAEKARRAEEAIMAGRRQSGVANDMQTDADQPDSGLPDSGTNDTARPNVAVAGDAAAGAVRIEVDSFLREVQAIEFKEMPPPLLPPKQ